MTRSPLIPHLLVLNKLGQIVQAATELVNGKANKKAELSKLLSDPVVVDWVKSMKKHRLLLTPEEQEEAPAPVLKKEEKKEVKKDTEVPSKT